MTVIDEMGDRSLLFLMCKLIELDEPALMVAVCSMMVFFLVLSCLDPV